MAESAAVLAAAESRRYVGAITSLAAASTRYDTCLWQRRSKGRVLLAAVLFIRALPGAGAKNCVRREIIHVIVAQRATHEADGDAVGHAAASPCSNDGEVAVKRCSIACHTLWYVRGGGGSVVLPLVVALITTSACAGPSQMSVYPMQSGITRALIAEASIGQPATAL